MVRCRCQMHEVDTNCGTGLYMIGKVTGINALIAVKGFLDLSDYTRQRVLGERDHWLEEYHKHVQNEGNL
jgi:hypothetical protein